MYEPRLSDLYAAADKTRARGFEAPLAYVDPLMRLRPWEIGVAIAALLIVALWLAGGLIIPAIVLLALIAFGIGSRATVVERQIAGAHAQSRALLTLVSALALFTILIVSIVLLWVVDRRDWTDETPGLIAAYALAGLAIYLLRDVQRLGDKALDYFIGGSMERHVAKALDPLRDLDWTVAHDIPREGRGNVDHFVSGPSGSFAIETKSGRYHAADRGQAISNAIWTKEKFGKRFVTAVLCVATDPPDQPRKELHGRSEVWVVGPAQVRDWIVAYRWVPKPP